MFETVYDIQRTFHPDFYMFGIVSLSGALLFCIGIFWLRIRYLQKHTKFLSNWSQTIIALAGFGVMLWSIILLIGLFSKRLHYIDNMYAGKVKVVSGPVHSYWAVIEGIRSDDFIRMPGAVFLAKDLRAPAYTDA